jgi:hypothetical protein
MTPSVAMPISTEEQTRKMIAKAKALIKKSDTVLKNAGKDIEEARELVAPAGLSVDSSILDPTYGSSDAAVAVLRTTGGFSNTDHVVKITGDARRDRIDELKRSYQRRVRSSQPEERGDHRWDKPKVPGERRRRIVRHKDAPEAPPEPPPTGYVLFVSQMTTKIRHDRPNEQHQQTMVIKEISNIWKHGMTDDDREYYNEFAREAREEYVKLHQEFRATGRYEPSHRFQKLQGVGSWVRSRWEEKNGLERELSTYETVLFPLRPPQLDEAYEKRRLEGLVNRKRRQKEEAAKKRARGEDGGEVGGELAVANDEELDADPGSDGSNEPATSTSLEDEDADQLGVQATQIVEL